MTRKLLAARDAGLGLLATALGCVSVPVDPEAGFPALAATIQERAGQRIAWSRGEGDEEIARAVQGLLAGGLCADEAVGVALLNNRDLQATYAELGVAQADLVQASLLHNPVLSVGSGLGGGPADLLFSLALDVVDLFYVPLRKRTAAADFEEARLLVAGQVLDVAWATRTAFTEHQADEQVLEMRQQIAASTAASFEVARRMREAGNLRELDLARERARAGQARLELREAELAARRSRERLNALLGLWGEGAAWTLVSARLPDPALEPLEAEGLESRAIEQSLDLAAAGRHVAAAAENLGLTRASRFFPELVVGGEGEREGGDWDAGPSAAIPIPLFDRGQARVARGEMELLRARDRLHGIAVRIRAAVRAARDRVIAERERALYYRSEQLPLQDHVVREAQLQYNAMQLGVLELLRAKEEQIATAVRYLETLRAYWLARADLDLLLAGRLPPPEQAGPAPRFQELPRFPFPTLQ